jgi:class 3 adenylate cyclase
MTTTRRLAAILAADVVGYSRLMGADEEGTLERLKAFRRELVDPKITEHHGRIVKTTGDGMLVEFTRVADVVRCAVEVQQGMAERNNTVPANRRIEFRSGSISATSSSRMRTSSATTSMLPPASKPGEICVSRVARDQVRDKLDFAFEDQGAQQVKNIARAVRIYRIAMAENARATAPISARSPIHAHLEDMTFISTCTVTGAPTRRHRCDRQRQPATSLQAVCQRSVETRTPNWRKPAFGIVVSCFEVATRKGATGRRGSTEKAPATTKRTRTRFSPRRAMPAGQEFTERMARQSRWMLADGKRWRR